MKIESGDKLVNFGAIIPGECFRYEGELYIRMMCDKPNCVRLVDGKTISLSNIAKVIPVEAVVTVKR